jgi:hypothetical protein
LKSGESKRGNNLVLSECCVVREDVSGRGDGAGVDVLELLDVEQDGVDLALEVMELQFRKIQTGEVEEMLEV